MSAIAISVPVPVGNGTGASVAVAAFGFPKNVIIAGTFQASVTLEASPDGVNWGPIATYTKPGCDNKAFTALFVRARVAGYINGIATLTLAAETAAIAAIGTLLPVPVVNGIGPAVATSTLGELKTIVVNTTSPFIGAVNIESSDDGVTWGCVATFTDVGLFSLELNAQFMRTRMDGFQYGTATCGVAGIVADGNTGAAAVIAIGAMLVGGMPDAVLYVAPGPSLGQVISVTPAGQIDVGDGASAGVASEWSRADHQHALPAPGPGANLPVGVAPVAGVSTLVAREDHTHGLPVPGPATSLVAGAASAAGASLRVALEDHEHGVPVAAAGTIAVGDVAGAGVATTLARADHQHALPAPAAPANVDKSAASAGVATTVARADHKHDVTTAAPGSIVPDAVAAEGVATTLARSDHTHGILADVPVSTATANVEGVSTAFARADHQHRTLVEVQDEGALVGSRPTINFIGSAVTAVDNGGADRVDVTITASPVTSVTVPTPIDVGDAGVIGVSTEAARADHQHALPAPAAPANVDKSAASAGVATTVARADHKHDVTTAAPTAGAVAVGNVAAEGVATTLARSDHTHAVARGVPVSVGTANAAGAAASFAGSDHVHAHGAQPIGAGTDHAVATIALAGFMSAADKTKLDGIASSAAPAVLSWGCNSIAAGADTRFVDTWNSTATAGTAIDPTELVVPRAGTLRRLFVRHRSAAGNGNSVVYTVMVNGVATAITAALATGAIGQASDLVNSVVVAAGDRVALRAVKALGIGSGVIIPIGTLELAA